jgi:hypothetical protein
MFKVSHTTLIVISGLVWLAVGCFLLPLGLNFIAQSMSLETAAEGRPVLNNLAPYVGGLEQAAIALIVIALGIGYLKGTKIFSKTVQSSVDRIRSLPNPAPISQIYTKKYYILLGSMVFLGFLVRFLSNDIRGAVDVVIGSALINGAVLFIRQALTSRVKA